MYGVCCLVGRISLLKLIPMHSTCALLFVIHSCDSNVASRLLTWGTFRMKSYECWYSMKYDGFEKEFFFFLTNWVFNACWMLCGAAQRISIFMFFRILLLVLVFSMLTVSLDEMTQYSLSKLHQPPPSMWLPNNQNVYRVIIIFVLVFLDFLYEKWLFNLFFCCWIFKIRSPCIRVLVRDYYVEHLSICHLFHNLPRVFRVHRILDALHFCEFNRFCFFA